MGRGVWTWNIAPVNLKVGLTNNIDLQLFFDSYIHERIEVTVRERPRPPMAWVT